ncbi:hypothetical protein DSM21852_28080 [Methylocystis bryophila]|nr:hypothetical protein DSM21852_28080 [Methylocystis bryophila]
MNDCVYIGKVDRRCVANVPFDHVEGRVGPQKISEPLDVESADAMPSLNKFWNKNGALKAASSRDKYVHPSSEKTAPIDAARYRAGR